MPTTHTIDDLRAELFETLRRLKDKDAPMEVERAKAIIGVASVIVDTAKVEVAMLEATGVGDTGFIQDRKALPAGARPALAAANGGRR